MPLLAYTSLSLSISLGYSVFRYRQWFLDKIALLPEMAAG
jgi:hypothetical protein